MCMSILVHATCHTPLMQYGRGTIARMLVEADAGVDIAGPNGCTPLLVACEVCISYAKTVVVGMEACGCSIEDH